MWSLNFLERASLVCMAGHFLNTCEAACFWITRLAGQRKNDRRKFKGSRSAYCASVFFST